MLNRLFRHVAAAVILAVASILLVFGLLYASDARAQGAVKADAGDSTVAKKLTQAVGELTCQGEFMNPITDICWSCVFPITIGSARLFSWGQEDTDLGTGSAVCSCSGPSALPTFGLRVNFWEPARLFEAVRKPHCYPSLGGIMLDTGIKAKQHVQTGSSSRGSSQSFYNVHWYMNPLMFWLEILLDNVCLEKGQFDIAFATEYDPTWDDFKTNFLINPDSVLYANPIAVAACVGDCVSASMGFAQNLLYWCAGCQGSMYPMMGYTNSHGGGVAASVLLMQRLTNKLHRQGMMWSGTNNGGCGLKPEFIMDKRGYKYAMTYPIPSTKKIPSIPKMNSAKVVNAGDSSLDATIAEVRKTIPVVPSGGTGGDAMKLPQNSVDSTRCCSPFGRTTIISGAGREIPYMGEDFAFQIFRKRTCCTDIKGLLKSAGAGNGEAPK